MSFMNGNSFTDRQAAAAKARKALADKFLTNAKYDPNDPVVLEREAKRKAIFELRAVREVERAQRRAEAAAAEAARKAAKRRPRGRSSCASRRWLARPRRRACAKSRSGSNSRRSSSATLATPRARSARQRRNPRPSAGAEGRLSFVDPGL